jgi:hypothetical protein
MLVALKRRACRPRFSTAQRCHTEQLSYYYNSQTIKSPDTLETRCNFACGSGRPCDGLVAQRGKFSFPMSMIFKVSIKAPKVPGCSPFTDALYFGVPAVCREPHGSTSKIATRAHFSQCLGPTPYDIQISVVCKNPAFTRSEYYQPSICV